MNRQLISLSFTDMFSYIKFKSSLRNSKINKSKKVVSITHKQACHNIYYHLDFIQINIKFTCLKLKKKKN